MSTAFVEQFGGVTAEGPEWLAELRRQSMERFQAHGIPTSRDEDWHFTNPAAIGEAGFGPMPSSAGVTTAADLAPFLVGHAEWPRLVFVNGRFNPALSRAESLGEGVRAMSLATALREEPTLIERHLAKLVRTDVPAQAFAALNTALMADGALVHVARGAVPAAPIHLLFVTDTGAALGAAHPRTLIVVEPEANVTVIEQYIGPEGVRYFTNAVTEAVVGDGATLHHYRLQREGREAYHVGTFTADQGRDSHLVSFSFATGAALARANIYTVLGGAGCGATLNGLYMLGGEQHGDHQTRIEHVAPNCYSREVYKGVLDGNSHGVFNGKVYVHPEAQKTDGKQTNNTLLLSERARIDTKPQLEIFADDVKCTHGATVGRIDETALFYMKSRGIAANEARRLLTYAFAADVLETIPLEPLRDALEHLALARFTGALSEA